MYTASEEGGRVKNRWQPIAALREGPDAEVREYSRVEKHKSCPPSGVTLGQLSVELLACHRFTANNITVKQYREVRNIIKHR